MGPLVLSPASIYRRHFPSCCSALVALLLLAVTSGATAAPPTINNLSLRGLQSGATTTLVIDGADLLPQPQVLLGTPIAKQTLKPGATATHAEFEITLGSEFPTGLYPLRVATTGGISDAAPIGVDSLPQAPWSAELATLPIALTGTLGGNQVLQSVFTGKKGDEVVVEVEARRLGSVLNPELHLYDSRHVQIAWAQAQSLLGGDARLSVKLPTDGKYSVEIHDALYQAGGPGYFRLKVGAFHYADFVLPLALQRGKAGTLEFVSTNLSGERKAAIQTDEQVGIRPAIWPPAPALSGARPGYLASDMAEVVQQPVEGDKLQEATAPVGISGHLLHPGREDSYRVVVKPGAKLHFEVTASAIGSPLDGVLMVRNAQGQQLAMNDDRPGTSDPGLDLTVPDGVAALIVALKDLEGRGGDQFVYRIAITEMGQPDFSLNLKEDRQNIPAGGAALLRIETARNGYAGPIALKFDGLPAGVKASANSIPAGANVALVTLFADASATPAAGVFSLVGEGTATPPLMRLAQAPVSQLSLAQPWFRSQVAVAVTNPAPLTIAWANTNGDEHLPLGGKLPIALQVTRTGQAAGPVRITLLTSQEIPKVQSKEPKKDGDKPPADDMARAIRLEQALTVPADQSQATANLLVPGDLPPIDYDLIVQAELLSADQKTVQAVAFTPARRMLVSSPLKLELTSDANIEVRAGLGATGKLQGKVVRAAGFNRPVTLSLEGLPKEVTASRLEIPADHAEFEFPISVPFGTAPGDMAGVTLVGTAQSNPENAASVVRSAPIPLHVKIVPGEKPAAEKPLTIFEDDAKFVADLNEGSGQVSLVMDDKFSGKASVKVTPDQRFNPTLPGLGVKIRQNPGPGEFRYVRFAWKKKGGEQLCIQLSHDGIWGPEDGKPAKYRYQAGPAPEAFGGALKVADKLPADWTLVTRDLYADFGDFTLTGLALSPLDGEYALFDHLYLGRTTADLDSAKP